jgi:isoquinoline 1-oxidoreductase beta subunit
LETNCAVADVRPGSAEIWSRDEVADLLPGDGGADPGIACIEREGTRDPRGRLAVTCSPTQRTDNFRQGRVHPMCTSRVRIAYLGSNVVAFDQRHTSVATDFTQGLGEILSATFANLPEGDVLGYSQGVFTLTANVPYIFGAVTQLLNEVYHPPGSVFNTSSVRNIYSPEVTVAKELMVDQAAKAMGQAPYQVRTGVPHARRTGCGGQGSRLG